MKGHVGGGPGSCSFKVQGARVQNKPFLQVVGLELAPADKPACPKHVSIREYDFVQEWLLEMSGLARAFHLGQFVHKLESLIMAQNERWRHA